MAANLHHKGNILRFWIFIKDIGTRILQQRKVDVNECMECALQKYSYIQWNLFMNGHFGTGHFWVIFAVI